MRSGTTGAALGLCVIVVVIAPAPSARAQPADGVEAGSPAPEGGAAEAEPPAAEPPTVLPGEADGIAVGDSHPERELLWIPRVLLAPLRLALLVGTEPVYQLARLEDEYELQERAIAFFFNEERTFGWYPTAFFETGFGFNVGVRVVNTDLFGDNERLILRAGYGQQWRQEYGYRLSSGDRFGDFRLALDVGYRRKPRKRFFGFGPENQRPARDVQLPLDARTADVAVRSVYRLEQAGGAITAAGPVGGDDRWALQLTHQWRWRRFSTGKPRLATDPPDAWLDEIYLPETVDGFLDIIWDNYNELRLRFDNRVTRHPHLPIALPSAGWKVAGWAGWHVEPGEPRSYGRIGLDVQPFVDLYNGDRVLRFRLRVASVLGPISQIPFVDRPHLGGSVLLRGYPRERFRGRASALGQVEYRYPIQPVMSGYVFADAGRVWEDGQGASFDDFRDLRLGFGGGLLLYTKAGFLMGAQVSTSIDGGVFVRVNLNATDGLVAPH